MGMLGQEVGTRTKLEVVKVRAGQACEGVFVCSWVCGFWTHWVVDRSLMCCGDRCPACLAAVGGRWTGLLAVRVSFAESRRVCWVEVSASAWDRFAGICAMEGVKVLTGHPVRFERRRAKSPLVVDLLSGPGVEVKEMPDWRLRDGLATLYGLPGTREGESVDEWEERAQPVALRLLEVAMTRLQLECDAPKGHAGGRGGRGPIAK